MLGVPGGWQGVWAGEPGREKVAFSGYPPQGARLGPQATEGPGTCRKGADSDSPVEDDRGHSGISSLSSLSLGTATPMCTGGLCSPHPPFPGGAQPCQGGLTPGPDPTIHPVLLCGLSRHPRHKSSNTECPFSSGAPDRGVDPPPGCPHCPPGLLRVLVHLLFPVHCHNVSAWTQTSVVRCAPRMKSQPHFTRVLRVWVATAPPP